MMWGAHLCRELLESTPANLGGSGSAWPGTCWECPSHPRGSPLAPPADTGVCLFLLLFVLPLVHTSLYQTPLSVLNKRVSS